MTPAPKITFRPITADDSEFLYTVYAGTRTEELAMVDWPESQKQAFLRSQFNAQHTAYQRTYQGGNFLVILRDGQPIGRLYLARWPQEIRVVDITLVPEYRNAGIGTAILKDLLAEGKREGKCVSIHVEIFNPALALYRRLGFRKLGDHGPYYLFKWSPDSVD